MCENEMVLLVCTFVTLLSLISVLCILRLWNILQNCGLLWFPTVFVILSDLLTRIKYLSSLTVFWNPNFFWQYGKSHTCYVCLCPLPRLEILCRRGGKKKKKLFSVCCIMHICCGRQCMKHILVNFAPFKGSFLTILMGNISRLFSSGFSFYPTVFAISDLPLYLLPCVSSCWWGLCIFFPYSSFWWTWFLSFLLMTPVLSFSSGTATPQALRNMWLMHKHVHDTLLQSIFIVLQSTRLSFEPIQPI